MQASLPTSLGGLGVRSTARAAPAAFLGSWAFNSRELSGGFSRELSGAALSAVGFAVSSVGGVR
jgi:hypothetical protein